MNKSEEFLKKDALIKKYSKKPFPRFLKHIGLIRDLSEYEDWIKDQNRLMIRWVGTYLIILPFLIAPRISFIKESNKYQLIEMPSALKKSFKTLGAF